VLNLVTDFLFLTSESLHRKKEELFGFSLLLEQDNQDDEVGVFNRLKALVFLAPRENRVWAGPGVVQTLTPQFSITQEEPLAEILGPPVSTDLPPLTVDRLLEMTGWIEALKTPLSRQLNGNDEGKAGKILRLKGQHLNEKYFVLKTVLNQIYGVHENFPVLFPLENSRDFLSQLLARIDPEIARAASPAAESSWDSMLLSRGGGDYPGDSGKDDVLGALTHYFRAVIKHLMKQGLPPVFVFVFPHGYEPEAQSILETILGELVTQNSLRLLLLEPQETTMDFLGRYPSLSWTFPTLTLERIQKERDSHGWQERFPVLDKQVLESCGGHGLAWVHHLWMLQEQKTIEYAQEADDPSWSLFLSLDTTHHKVYFVFWASRGLLEEEHLTDFFQTWGEDASVIQDKVAMLRSLGFFLGGLSQPLRPEFGTRLLTMIGTESQEILSGLGKYLHRRWKRDHRLSEILYSALRDWGLHGLAVEVLTHYLTNKINQGQEDFLRLLRQSLWDEAPNEELKNAFRLASAAAKLRFSLNLTVNNAGQGLAALQRFRRHFTPQTEENPHAEWLLQQGRFYLCIGDLTTGFTLLKKALSLAQERKDTSLEVQAETEIGLTLLRKNRLEEGHEYFDIASRLAEKTGSHYLIALTSGYEASACFLIGHLFGAKQALERGLLACGRGGLQKRKVFLIFLAARIEFDQGDYTAALSLLHQASAAAVRYRLVEAQPILTLWQGRALAYSGNLVEARSLLESQPLTAERQYYLSETLYLSRELNAALENIRLAKPLVKITQAFGVGEDVDWKSGYAGAEDRALAQPGELGVLENQIDAFLGLLEGLSGNSSEAVKMFQMILTRKHLLDLDPSSALYYYWYYLTLPRNDSTHEAQRLTLLGRALKDVQVRSSRIEDPVQRHQYLLKPHWNAQFALEAKKLKLL